VYIDEPEISLHPTWQIKILPFLKSLFRNEKSEQTSQIFIATHSPFIIHNENRENDKVIILKNDGGKISVSGERKFHFWDREKIVQEAFNISHDLQIEPKGLTVFVEGPTDEKYLTKANELYQISKNIRFKSIGQNTKQGSQGGGDTGLNNARTFLLANPEHMRGAAVLYYDPDKKMNAQDFDSLHIRGMPVLDNKVFRKGIENLLSLPDDFDRTAFYRKKETVDDYGAKKDNEEFQKVLLCDFICSLPSERASVYLVNVADTIRSQLLGLIP
jgi:hypothetical protein